MPARHGEVPPLSAPVAQLRREVGRRARRLVRLRRTAIGATLALALVLVAVSAGGAPTS